MGYTRFFNPWYNKETQQTTPFTAASMNYIETGVQTAAAIADTAAATATTLGALVKSGTGSPEGVLTAPVGTIFLRTDGASGSTLYVKESGAGNTGWIAKMPLAPVKTAATVGALGSGTNDGDLGIIRVGTWPDQVEVLLKWNAGQSKWVGEPMTLVTCLDQFYLGINTATYSYPQVDDSNVLTHAAGYTARAIQHADLLFAAGLSLQSSFSGFLHGTASALTLTANVFWFNHNNGATVTFSTDGSTAIGTQKTQIASGANAAVILATTGWDYVGINGTPNTPLSTTQVTANNLWPRVYGKLSSASGSFGGMIDLDVQARWTT